MSNWRDSLEIVNDRISIMNDVASQAIGAALNVPGGATYTAWGSGFNPPEYNGDFGAPFQGGLGVDRPEVTLPRELDFEDPVWEEIDVDVQGLIGLISTTPPDLISITEPQLPERLPYGDAPVRPDTPTIEDIPFDPSQYLFPAPPELVAINIPTLDVPDPAPFTEVPPDFTETPPNAVVNFQPIHYTSDMLDRIKAKLIDMMDGKLGLEDWIERAMYERALAREDMASSKATDELTTSFAARGWSLPPGVLLRQTALVTEENRIKAQAHNRDVLIEAAKWRIESVRAAVTAGIQLEGQLIDSFNQIQRLTLDAQRAQVEAETARFNALVSAYQVRGRMFELKLQQWEAGLKLVSERIRAYEARVNAERAKADVNDALVRAYAAEIGAVREKIGVFVARVEAQAAKARIAQAILQAYGEDVRAYAERVRVSLADYQRYEAEARVKVSMNEINNTRLAAFRETVQAQTAVVNAKARAIEIELAGLNAEANRFEALVRAKAAKAGAQAQIEQVKAQLAQAEAQMYNSDVQLATSERSLEQQRITETIRNTLALHEINVRQFDAFQTRLIESARIQSAAIQAQRDVAARIGAGAMAAINVGASVGGSYQQSDQQSNQVSASYQNEGAPAFLPIS